MDVTVPAVVLAAGRSRRMGQTKALLPTTRCGETFISRIVRVLGEAGHDEIVVVAGSNASTIMRTLGSDRSRARVVINPEPDRGQLSSLLVGLSVVDRPGVTGVLVTLVDVPLIDEETVRRLRAVYERTRAPLVRPVRAGRHGHPVIFDRAVFDELRRADPELGAKPVVRAHSAESVDVPIEREGPFIDIDTPDVYARVFGTEIPRQRPGLR